MEQYIYLSLLPESLIASMLEPEEFGNYLAVGSRKRTRGEAFFFELEPDFQSDFFPLHNIQKRCILTKEGKPKRSVYLSIYRVLEHVPLSALKNLYLVTDDGRVLEIAKQDFKPDNKDNLHLYQEICPIAPRIASKLNPSEFCRYITDPQSPISIPKLVFAELILDGLGENPTTGSVDNLPYPNIDHLKDCLIGLQKNPQKPNKTVLRSIHSDILFRTIRNGFFVGDRDTFYYYPFPSQQELEEKFYVWWRSALTQGFGSCR